jgi:hypothetical protein
VITRFHNPSQDVADGKKGGHEFEAV